LLQNGCFGDGKKKGSRGTGMYYMLNIQFNEVDANDFKPDRLHRKMKLTVTIALTLAVKWLRLYLKK
jgi:hypothetical protein